MDNRWRRFIRHFHPEGIPWPASILYNALSSTGIFLRHYELVADDVARFGPSERLIDIGTGPGQLLLALRRTLPDSKLVGVDISTAMAAQALRTLKASGHDPYIEVMAAGASALPFSDGSFDRVVSTGSLHHWKQPLQALAEAHRVLKMNGHALLYDLVRDMPEAVRKEVRSRFGGFRLALLGIHSFEEPFLNAGEMEALGRQTQFLVEGTRFVGALCCLVLRKVSLFHN